MASTVRNSASLTGVSLSSGTVLTLEGTAWTLTGVVKLRIVDPAPEPNEPFEEYLEYHFRNASGENAWLVEELGHWVWLRRLSSGVFPEPAGARPADASSLRYGDVEYGRNGRGVALLVVAWSGTFSEEPDPDETIHSVEFFSGDALLAVESSGSNWNVTRGIYLTPEEVARAAGVPSVSSPKYLVFSEDHVVHPLAPNPYMRALPWFAGLASAFLLGGWLVYGHDNRHLSEPWPFAYTEAEVESGRVTLSDPFRIGETMPQKVAVHVQAHDLAQQWIEVNAVLLSEDGKTSFEADLEPSNHWGSDWSENHSVRSAWFAAVPPGMYRVKFARTAGNAQTVKVGVWVAPREAESGGFGFYAFVILLPSVCLLLMSASYRSMQSSWGRS